MLRGHIIGREDANALAVVLRLCLLHSFCDFGTGGCACIFRQRKDTPNALARQVTMWVREAIETLATQRSRACHCSDFGSVLM